MKISLPLLLIGAILLIGCVSATVINSTVLLTTDYSNALSMTGSDPFTSKLFSVNAKSGSAIVVTELSYYTEGEIIKFKFVRPSGTDITGTITLTSTGLFSGQESISIDGGTSSVIPYSKVPLYPYYPPNNFFYVTTGSSYYFVITDSSRFNFAVSGDIFHPVYAPFKLDTTQDAYIQISGNPFDAPIKQAIITPINSGTYTALVYQEPIADLKEAVVYTNSTQAAQTGNGNDLSFLTSLVKAITGTYTAIQGFFRTLTTLSTWMMAAAAFLFAGKVLIGLIVVYTLMNIVYCMRPRKGGIDDIWAAMLEFYNNEILLFTSFMKIINWIKDLIKWW